jgi:RNA polymerase sigma-70 factor (ECF subfamily)
MHRARSSDPRDVTEPARPAADPRVIERLRDGDATAFREVFDELFPRLRGYAARLVQSTDVADELVHDVFLQLWRDRGRLDPTRSVSSYIFTAVRHRALDHLKRERVRLKWERAELTEHAPLGGEPPAPVVDASQSVEQDEVTRAIWAAVFELPPRVREAVLLRWREQRSYAEVAEIMGIAGKTVEIHIGRAIKALRDSLPRHLSE